MRQQLSKFSQFNTYVLFLRIYFFSQLCYLNPDLVYCLLFTSIIVTLLCPSMCRIVLISGESPPLSLPPPSQLLFWATVIRRCSLTSHLFLSAEEDRAQDPALPHADSVYDEISDGDLDNLIGKVEDDDSEHGGDFDSAKKGELMVNSRGGGV